MYSVNGMQGARVPHKRLMLAALLVVSKQQHAPDIIYQRLFWWVVEWVPSSFEATLEVPLH